jgi:hypothetical protein
MLCCKSRLHQLFVRRAMGEEPMATAQPALCPEQPRGI